MLSVVKVNVDDRAGLTSDHAAVLLLQAVHLHF
jgi:hypothetical protein